MGCTACAAGGDAGAREGMVRDDGGGVGWAVGPCLCEKEKEKRKDYAKEDDHVGVH